MEEAFLSNRRRNTVFVLLKSTCRAAPIGEYPVQSVESLPRAKMAEPIMPVLLAGLLICATHIVGASGPSSLFAKLWLSANLCLEGLKAGYDPRSGLLTVE